MDLLERVGSYAGLGAFLGLAVLALLYFSQARDVRRLREWAGRAPERAGETTAQTPAARHGLPPVALAQHESRPRKRVRDRMRNIHVPNLRYVGATIGLLLLLGGAAYAAVQLADNSGDNSSSGSTEQRDEQARSELVQQQQAEDQHRSLHRHRRGAERHHGAGRGREGR